MEKRCGELSRPEQADLLEKYSKGATAPELAREYNVTLSSLRNPLSRYAPKGMGRGGSRKNSGNKKGVEFCAVCRKKVGNCAHTK